MYTNPPPSHLKYCTSINMVVSATPFSSENLFQAPNKWTPRHLQRLNIEEHHHLPASAIVEDANLPKDDNPCMLTLHASFPTIVTCQYLRPSLMNLPNQPDTKSTNLTQQMRDDSFRVGFGSRVLRIWISTSDGAYLYWRGSMAHFDSKNAL